MKWINKWFLKKYKQAEVATPVTNNRIETEKTITLNVTKANGGWVIEHRQFDQQKDRYNNGLHIITEDKDLGKEIGKIITFESLYN